MRMNKVKRAQTGQSQVQTRTGYRKLLDAESGTGRVEVLALGLQQEGSLYTSLCGS